MRFRIGNGLEIGDGTNYMLSGIEGLEVPELRLGDGVYAGRDGGFVSGHFYGQRTLVFKGFYIGNNCEEADELRLTLFRFLRIRFLAPIFILTNTGKYYYTEGYVSDVKSQMDTNVSGQFQISFRCPDPFIYDGGDGISEASIWETDNLVFDDTVRVLNGGGVDTSPIITMTGLMENPIIYNNTTLEKMELELVTTEETDVVEINMQKRIITLNGSSVNIDRSVDSSWWMLQTGLNDIMVTATYPEIITGFIADNWYPAGTGIIFRQENFSKQDFDEGSYDWMVSTGMEILGVPREIYFSYYDGRVWLVIEPTVGNSAYKQYDTNTQMDEILADAESLGIRVDVERFFQSYSPSPGQSYNDSMRLNCHTSTITIPPSAIIKHRKGYAGI